LKGILGTKKSKNIGKQQSEIGPHFKPSVTCEWETWIAIKRKVLRGKQEKISSGITRKLEYRIC
jgi:hypothetical protein